MKTVLLNLLLSLALLVPAHAQRDTQKKFVLYAQFLQDTQVELSDGATWMMDKGDCFPIYQFKEHQTKIVLQIASTTFMVDAERMKVLKESDNDMALQSYRKNLQQYLNGRAEAWKKDANVKKKKPEPGN